MTHGMSVLSLPWAPGIRGEKHDDTSVDWGLTNRVRKQQIWEISFSESVLISEKQNTCQLFVVGVMRYNGLIVIPGTSWALGPVAVVVIVAMKQCNERMGKAQRSGLPTTMEPWGRHVSGQYYATEIYSVPAYIPLSNSHVSITCHLETSTQESVSFFLPLVTSIV